MKQTIIISIGIKKEVFTKATELREIEDSFTYYFSESTERESIKFFIGHASRCGLKVRLVLSGEVDEELSILCNQLGVEVYVV